MYKPLMKFLMYSFSSLICLFFVCFFSFFITSFLNYLKLKQKTIWQIPYLYIHTYVIIYNIKTNYGLF